MDALARRLPQFVSAALLTLAVAAVLATYRDYGVTWDEGVQQHYGELALHYFSSGMVDRRVDEFLNLRFYGPLFELLTALLPAGDMLARFELRHLCTALVGLLGLLGVHAFGAATGVRWLPPLGVLSLLTMPRFWGHLFNNSKDTPFSAAFAVAMASMAALLLRPGRPLGRVLLAGTALGLAAALRPGGLPLLALLLALTLLATIWLDGESLREGLPDALRKGVAALLLAWLLMVQAWPWAHASPLANPLRAMLEASAFHHSFAVLWDGQVVQSTELTRAYALRFMLMVTPPASLALAALGFFQAVRMQRRAPRSRLSAVLALLQLWLLLPLLLVAALRPNVYDGLRHLLFLLPALALFAGLGVHGLSRALPEGMPRRATTAVLIALLLSPLPAMLRLHPYQSSYFSPAVGGLAAAEGRYETDYWASSYGEAVRWLAEHTRGQGRQVEVAVAANRWSIACALPYAPPHMRIAPIFVSGFPGDLPGRADYYIATYRYGQARNFPDAPIIHRIGRDGATFTVIRKRGAPAP